MHTFFNFNAIYPKHSLFLYIEGHGMADDAESDGPGEGAGPGYDQGHMGQRVYDMG